MKVVILAGGYGTRLSEETQLKPKPMVEIGGKPILWHIMKEISFYGFNEFIICCGYKQHMIKEWFADYYLHTSDITFDFTLGGEMIVHNNVTEPWKVTIIDTGLDTLTGGRIKRIQPYVENESFIMTYGDGVSNIDIRKLVEFHKKHGKIATLTSVIEKQRFGVLEIKDCGEIIAFHEKASKNATRVSAGYMVLEPQIFEYLEGDNTCFEKEPLERLASEQQLMAFRHNGFWQCMDTKREHEQLEQMWANGNAPWKLWT